MVAATHSGLLAQAGTSRGKMEQSNDWKELSGCSPLKFSPSKTFQNMFFPADVCLNQWLCYGVVHDEF